MFTLCLRFTGIMAGDEDNTSLIPDDRPRIIWKHSPLRWNLKMSYSFFLLAEIAAVGFYIYEYWKIVSPIFTSKNATQGPVNDGKRNTSEDQLEDVSYLNMTKTYSITLMTLNSLDTLNCWIFLGVIVTSPLFIGCSTMMKNLSRLPRFWTLLFCFFVTLSGNIIEIVSPFVFMYSFPLTTALSVTFIISALSQAIMLGALNQTKICDLVQGETSTFKGALTVFFVRLLANLIVTTFHLTVILCLLAGAKERFSKEKGAITNSVIMFLYLPFYKMGTGLLWSKILRDDGHIFGRI